MKDADQWAETVFTRSAIAAALLKPRRNARLKELRKDYRNFLLCLFSVDEVSVYSEDFFLRLSQKIQLKYAAYRSILYPLTFVPLDVSGQLIIPLWSISMQSVLAEWTTLELVFLGHGS